MENIHARLGLKTRQMIERLQSEGWKFEDDYWESGHNGDPYYDVKFKSPKMEEFARGIGEHEWETITEKSLRKREAAWLAHRWTGYVFHDENLINDPVEKIVTEHLLKTETAEFKNEPEPEVSVKISPKVKSPKKVKITIEIT